MIRVAEILNAAARWIGWRGPRGLKVLRPRLEYAMKRRFIGRVPLLQTHRFGGRKGLRLPRNVYFGWEDDLSSQFPRLDFRVLLAAFQWRRSLGSYSNRIIRPQTLPSVENTSHLLLCTVPQQQRTCRQASQRTLHWKYDFVSLVPLCSNAAIDACHHFAVLQLCKSELKN